MRLHGEDLRRYITGEANDDVSVMAREVLHARDVEHRLSDLVEEHRDRGARRNVKAHERAEHAAMANAYAHAVRLLSGKEPK